MLGFDLRGRFMRLADRERVVEHQVELHPVVSPGVAVAEIVIGQPAFRHLRVQQFAEVFFHRRIALVEQPAEALADQLIAHAQDVDRCQNRGDGIPPDPAGEFV